MLFSSSIWLRVVSFFITLSPHLKKYWNCQLSIAALQILLLSVNLFLFIGGGIDGAIANFYLSFNFDVALVDKGRLGCCCTACATALLEYQLDDYASDLEKTMSKEEIVQAYNMGLMAIQKISNFRKIWKSLWICFSSNIFVFKFNIFNW